MWAYILQGIGYGFAAASQPGPFQAYIISQSLRKGWKRTIISALAPLISDGPIVLLCVLVLSQVPVWMQNIPYIVGGLFVLYLAYGAYKAWRDFREDEIQDPDADKQGLLKAALMNMLSPGPYLFWALVTGPILIRGFSESLQNGIGFLAGFYVTLVSGLVVIILVFGLAKNLGPRVNKFMIGLSAITLFCFGLYQLWLGIYG